MTMTKADLVEKVAGSADVPRKLADDVVQVVLESIVDALHRNEKVELRGFGSFRIRQRDERTGRNPKTGEKVHVPRKRTPFFTVGKELKERVNAARTQNPPATD